MENPQLDLAQFVPYRLVDLANRMSQALAKIYQESFNISIAQWRVLAQLAEQQSLCAKDIGQVTAMDKSKVSRAVKLLLEKGLIDKQPNLQDNRAAYLSLSAAGQSLYKQIVPKVLACEQRLLANLQSEDKQQLMQIINRLDASLMAAEVNSSSD